LDVLFHLGERETRLDHQRHQIRRVVILEECFQLVADFEEKY
jgi:hypothetical protein